MGNGGFTAANGVVSGRGTANDPYIIEWWEIDASTAHGIEIRDTTAYFVVQTTSVSGGGSVYGGVYLSNVENALVEGSSATASRFGFLVEASRAVTLNANGASDIGLEGFGVVGGSDIVVTQNTVARAAAGVSVYAADRVNASWNRPSESSYGIRVLSSSNVTVESNTMGDNGNGVSLLNVQDTAVVANTITSTIQTTTGIEAIDVARVRIEGNDVWSRSTWGIAVGDGSRVTVSLNEIGNASTQAILLERTSFLTVVDNGVKGAGTAIEIHSSPEPVVSGNRLEDVLTGIRLADVTAATLSTNTMLGTGVTLAGQELAHFASHSISTNNLVNGRPVRYQANCAGFTLDGALAGQVIVVGCSGVRLSNLTLNETITAIQVFDSTSVEVDNVTIASIGSGAFGGSSGMSFVRTAGVTIHAAHLDSIEGTGISVQGSGPVRVASVRMSEAWQAISIETPEAIVLEDVMIAGPGAGIFLGGGPGPFAVRNVTATLMSIGIQVVSGHMGVIEDSEFLASPGSFWTGVTLSQASDVLVTRTNISSFRFGMNVIDSTDVRVHHNRFLGNEFQAIDSFGSSSLWDDGYPSGGNVWSDYRGWDDCGGLEQDVCPGSDGLGDIPYEVGGDSRDRYPIVEVNPPNLPPVASFVPGSAVVGVPVRLDASSSSDPDGWPLSFAWTYGDGQDLTTAEPVVSHTYEEIGTYRVMLTVTDVRGATNATALDLVVQAPPEPPEFEFVEFVHGAGFRLPVPVNWTRLENQTEGDSVTELVLEAEFGGFFVGVIVDTDRDPTVRETTAYLDSFVELVLADVRTEFPDASLRGTREYGTVANHSAVTFEIDYGSFPATQKAVFIVSEAHDRFWLLLLTTHTSVYAGVVPVFDTMVAGFAITQAASNDVGGLDLAAIGGLSAAGVAAALVAVFLIRARRARKAPPPPVPGPTAMLGPPASLPSTLVACPACGTQAAPGVPFCPQCGADLRRGPS